MGQTTDRIEHHIDETRQELGQHIHELQDKARNAVDWRYQTRERPWAMMGVAFGVGLAAAALASSKAWPSASTRSTRRFSGERDDSGGAAEIWNNIRYAAVAAILAKVKDVTREVVPGFWEHYEKEEPSTPSSRTAGPTAPNTSGAAI
jgi:hypothetical protein